MKNINKNFKSTQFQQADIGEVVLNKIKSADSQILSELLLSFFQSKILQQQYNVIITDLGCGEGNMLSIFLKSVQENFNNYFMLRIKIFGCEKEPDLRKKYMRKFSEIGREKHLKIVQEVDISISTIEDYQPKKSDLFLFSHSMYYPQTFWNTQRYNIEFEKHLLTRYLNQLTENGAIAIILQSGKNPEHQENKNNNSLANNEEFENIFYPIRQKAEIRAKNVYISSKQNEDKIALIKIQEDSNMQQDENSLTKSETKELKIIAEQENQNFTNAEIFLECYQEYVKLFKSKGNSDLFLLHRDALAVIEIGKLNFEDYDKKTEIYPQNDNVMKFLSFYTRGYYAGITKKFSSEDNKSIILKLSQDEQYEVLQFLKNNCLRISDDTCVMYHPNSIFVITPVSNFMKVQEPHPNSLTKKF